MAIDNAQMSAREAFDINKAAVTKQCVDDLRPWMSKVSISMMEDADGGLAL